MPVAIPLQIIVESVVSLTPPTQPVVAPVVVYVLGGGAALSVVGGAVGVGLAARERHLASGVLRGIPTILDSSGIAAAGAEPGDVVMPPVWRADP